MNTLRLFEQYDLAVVGEYPAKKIFVSLVSYQKITQARLIILEQRLAEYVTPYTFFNSELFVCYQSLKLWRQLDHKPYANPMIQMERQLFWEKLEHLIGKPLRWFYGLTEGYEQKALERFIDTDPDDQWREDMAEVERFNLLGF